MSYRAMGGLIRKPNRPAPTRFQKATPRKNRMGHRYACIQGLRPDMRHVSKASKPTRARGTTSSALNAAPTAMMDTGVPAK